jgi:hypothetical protein
MNMPRFTAEASLYKTSGHYQMAGAGISTGHLMPQASIVMPQWHPSWMPEWLHQSICLAGVQACLYACPLTGPAVWACLVACYVAYSSCTEG